MPLSSRKSQYGQKESTEEWSAVDRSIHAPEIVPRGYRGNTGFTLYMYTLTKLLKNQG